MKFEESLDLVFIYLGLANALQKAGYREREDTIAREGVELMKSFVRQGIWNKENIALVEAYCGCIEVPALLKLYKTMIGEKENEYRN